MNEMLKKICSFADKHNMLPEAGIVLVCVSGGADSMCLLRAFCELSQTRGFTVEAAHFNHMLRGAESDGDERFVRSYCAEHKIPLHTGRGDTALFASENSLGIEDAARQLRYAFFDKTAAAVKAARYATAHTADDNAETVIMNLTRGSGTAGMRGIPPVRGKIIRPMLSVSRDDVIEYTQATKTPFTVDSTNANDEFTRNRVRHTVIPVLKEMNPRFLHAVSSMTSHISEDDAYLTELSNAFIAENYKNRRVKVSKITALPDAVSGRVIMRLSGGKLSRVHIDAVRKICRSDNPSARVSVPGMMVSREYGDIIFGGETFAETFTPICPDINESCVIPGLNIKMTCNLVRYGDRINKSLTNFLFKYIELCGRITVRPRRHDDRIRLYGREGGKTLKKLFIERHIPAAVRPLIPVVADDRGVLAVYGIGISEMAAKGLKTGDLALEINFEGGFLNEYKF